MAEYERVDFPSAAAALRSAWEQHERGEEIVWTGQDRLHSKIAAVCPPPSQTFSKENLDYALDDQGYDFLDHFIQVAFQLGYHNGLVAGDEEAARMERHADTWREMYMTLKEKK